MRKQVLRTGCDREIDLVRADQLGNLFGRALMQIEIDPGINLAEGANNLGQDIAGLRVSRRDRKRAFLLGRQVAREASDVVDLTQNLPGTRDDVAAGRCDRREALALAREKLDAELGLELLQLLADPGLARIKPLGGRRDVQARVDDTDELLELFECHLLITGGAVEAPQNITIR